MFSSVVESVFVLDEYLIFGFGDTSLSFTILQDLILHCVKAMLLIMNIYKLVKEGMLGLIRSQCSRPK